MNTSFMDMLFLCNILTDFFSSGLVTSVSNCPRFAPSCNLLNWGWGDGGAGSKTKMCFFGKNSICWSLWRYCSVHMLQVCMRHLSMTWEIKIVKSPAKATIDVRSGWDKLLNIHRRWITASSVISLPTAFRLWRFLPSMGRKLEDNCELHRKLGDKYIEIIAITILLHCHVLCSLCAQKKATTPLPSSLCMLAFACLWFHSWC